MTSHARTAPMPETYYDLIIKTAEPCATIVRLLVAFDGQHVRDSRIGGDYASLRFRVADDATAAQIATQALQRVEHADAVLSVGDHWMYREVPLPVLVSPDGRMRGVLERSVRPDPVAWWFPDGALPGAPEGERGQA